MLYKWAPLPEGLYRPVYNVIKEQASVEMNYSGLRRRAVKFQNWSWNSQFALNLEQSGPQMMPLSDSEAEVGF